MIERRPVFLSPDLLRGPADAAPDAVAMEIWSGQVRLIGAGIIAVGALWTVASLAGSNGGSIRAALAAARGGGSAAPRSLGRNATSRSPGWRAAPSVWPSCSPACSGSSPRVAELGGLRLVVVAVATGFAVRFGFLMAAACGYLAGLLGSSSSPISGIGILTKLLAALLIPFVIGRAAGPEGDRFVIGLALLLAAVIVTTASIANDNLQDLKTGQLVDATPWRQ